MIASDVVAWTVGALLRIVFARRGTKQRQKGQCLTRCVLSVLGTLLSPSTRIELYRLTNLLDKTT